MGYPLNDNNKDPLGILPQKKEDPLGILKKKSGGVSGGTTGLSGGGLASQNVIEDNIGGIRPTVSDVNQMTGEAIHEAAPILSKTQLHEKATSGLQSRLVSKPPKTTDPLGEIATDIESDKNSVDDIFKDKTNPNYINAKATADKQLDLVKDELIPNGGEGREVLRGLLNQNPENLSDAQIEKLTPNTLTGKVAKDKYLQFRKTSDLFKNIGDPSDFENAAIKLKQAKGELQQNDYYLPETRGAAILDALKDKDVQYLAQTNPRFRNTYKAALNNFPVNHPESAEVVVRQYVSDQLEKRGLNNAFANITGQGNADKIVEEGIKNGDLPASYKSIYDERIRPYVTNLYQLVHGPQFATPGFIENMGASAEKNFLGVGKTIANVTGIRSLYKTPEDIKAQEINKEHADVYVNPENLLHKMSQTSGDMAGFVLNLVLGNEAALASGLIKSPQIASAVMMGLQTAGDYQDRAKLLTDNEALQQIYAATMTGLNMVGSKLLPGQNIGKLLAKEEPEIIAALTDVTENKITTQEAKEKITNRFVDFLKNTGKGALGGAEFGGAVSGVDDILSQVLQGKGVDIAHTGKQALEGAKQGLIGALPIAGAEAGIGALAKRGATSTEETPITQEKKLPEQPTPTGQPKLEIQQPEPQTDFETFKNHILDHVTNVKDNSFDYRITTGLNQEGIEQAVKNIKEGKDTKAARILLSSIQRMYDEGYVELNTSAGGLSQKIGIPLKEYMAETHKEHKPLTDDEIAQLNWELSEDSFKFDNNGQEEVHPTTQSTPTGETTPSSQEPSKTESNQRPNPKVPQEEVTPPTEPPVSEELSFGKSGKTGIAHDIQEARTYDTKSMPPERGEGVSVEDAIKHGQDLLKNGGDPQKAAEEFKKDKKVSFDGLSLVRAEHERLVRETNKAEDEFGENSKQYKEAVDKENKWYNDVVSPMKTEWHKIGMEQQGEVDIDTGSYTGLSRARRQATGVGLTSKEKSEAKILSSQVKSLTTQVETLKQRLTEALNRAEKRSPKSTTEKAKAVADRLRSFKSKGDKLQASLVGIPVAVYDGALETMATIIEKGGKIADAIKKGIDELKANGYLDTPWEEKEAANHFADISGMDVLTKFVDKKDNKFSPEEAKEIWDYAKENYVDKGANFDDMIHNTATDLGLKPKQIRDALTTPKGTKEITDEMYRKQYARNKAIRTAQDWAKSSQSSKLVKGLKAIPRFFFAAKVFGHGTVGMVTHAGLNMADPVEWKRYWPTFFKQFKFAYGDTAKYEQAMQDLVRDPQFIFWKRNGLAVDPTERYDDYQFITKIFDRMGTAGKWLTAGDRGFNALKVYRLERAKAIWNSLSNSEKADPSTAKEIAKLVNHSTGTTNLKVSEVAQTAFFAPNLELARWNKLIVDPAKAIKTFTNWSNATPSEKASAKLVAKRAGRIIGFYLTALAANQALLSLSGSKQQVNFFNPSQTDWLKFKLGDKTVDMTGGMVSLLGFLTRLTMVSVGPGKKGENRMETISKSAGQYAAGKLSPFASTVKDVATHQDYEGNVLPFYNDTPRAGKHKLSWKEYLLKQQSPIPVAEAVNDVSRDMERSGVDKPTVARVLEGVLIGGIVGGTGIHVREAPEEKPPKSQRPTIKNKIKKSVLKK